MIVGTISSNSQAGQSYNIEKFEILGTYPEDDAGLIKVKTEIQFGKFVKPIALSEEHNDDAISVVMSGWGAIIFGRTTYPENLRYMEFTTIPNDVCKNLIPSDFPPIVVPNYICTETIKGSKGACYGDAGDPVVAKDKQVGILSIGEPCAEGYPDVSARVSTYVKVIKKIISE